ncbi:hypothetical protein ACLHDG_06835 [Sulfurovum sp. CS9]|uniref:hypothetical protein n=1 Tax=Sulfurovum sp. CS9 TaxID=3391146 RepID=UPI0039ED8416
MKQLKILLLPSIIIFFSVVVYGADCIDGSRIEQGTGLPIDGNCVEPPTLPYPNKYDCGAGMRLIQGTADTCIAGIEVGDPGPYPPLIECPSGQRLKQGTEECIDVPNSSPVSLTLVSVLNDDIRETSGLANVNGKIYTHNDSGGSNLLYEINASTGEVIRSITVNGATNVDWEDLAYDDTHLYIADIGNNLGNRTDLKIYKILKSDLNTNLTVNAETIAFSYTDQIKFTYDLFSTPYDAEALIAYNGQLYVFIKNWADHTSKVYSIPTVPGSYEVTSVSEKALDVMVTGAAIDGAGSSVALVGYTNSYDTDTPFKSMIVKLSNFAGNNFFSGSIAECEIENSQVVGQVEAILFNTPSEFYLSAEGITVLSVEYPAKLYKTEIIE